MNVREMCHRISDMGLCKVEKGHTYSLREFNEAQFTQLSEVAGRLMEFRDLVKEVVRSACRTALLEAGFTPDDYFYDGGESPGMSYIITSFHVRVFACHIPILNSFFFLIFQTINYTIIWYF